MNHFPFCSGFTLLSANVIGCLWGVRTNCLGVDPLKLWAINTKNSFVLFIQPGALSFQQLKENVFYWFANFARTNTSANTTYFIPLRFGEICRADRPMKKGQLHF